MTVAEWRGYARVSISCGRCGNAIVPGDVVGYHRKVGYLCDPCCEAPPKPKPPAPVKGQLGLTL